ncbi:DUF3857 domain-containing protein [Mucilaginibacter daejeonensis]|uniref:DUF3857 domain-containing protein n=1 Tax=Mucilaginibacter daejeonensis TaxID=398049 RepID=UPI001D17CA85|nr:DUF3857 domain-containing protein [Mucilaginibacter daejeonensis]UEG53689.1 DUF3857 domain-containing protein [Mucilaginibacter daejeonensis]
MHTKPLRLSILLIGLFLAGLSLTTRAATPAVHISPRPTWLNTYQRYDKKVPLRTVENGYFYQLVEEQINVEAQATHRHMITEIISEAGIQNGSQIDIGFDPAYEQLSFHDVTVWRNGLPQKRLKPGIFKVMADEQELSRFIYQGSYSAYCILDDIRKGDRIEYSYTITGRNPIFDGHFSKDWYFQWSQPVAQVYRSLLVSPQRPLYFKYLNKVPQPKVSSKNGLTCYEWQSTQMPAAHNYDGEASWHNEYAHLLITDYRNWQQVADWALKVNPPAPTVKGALAQQVQAFKKEANGDAQRYFRLATTFVQDEVRYMGIEIGEYSHRANAPEKVFAQRYGDCKDKARLLVAMLTANGIEANMVLVNSSLKGHVADLLPSPNAFDHAVVTAVVNGRRVNVDATMSYQRGTGTNIYFPAYAKGLIVKPGTNALSTLEPGKAGKSTYVENYTIRNEKDSVKLDVTSVYTLNEADRMRDQLANKSMAETEKGYLEYYTRSHPKTAAADSLTVIDDPVKNVLTTIEHYRIADMLKRDSVSGKYKASFYANYVNNVMLNIADDAHVPLALSYPCHIDQTINVIMPGGWSIDEGQQRINNGLFDLTARTAANGDTMHLYYSFTNLSNAVPVNKLKRYKMDADKAGDDLLSYVISYTPDRSQLPFRPNYWMMAVAALLAGGLVALGIKIYRTDTDGIIFEPGAGFTNLGGWLILVAISLFLTPFAVLVSMLQANYFDLQTWNLQLPGTDQWAIKSTLIFEMVMNTFMISYAIFCLVLLINRRDILPKYITGLYALSVIYHIADYAVASQLNNGKVSNDAVFSIFKAIVVAAIWIPYFKRSARVERTFIVPYPRHNYRYEAAETPLRPVREDQLNS